jgi:hypothetical protein
VLSIKETSPDADIFWITDDYSESEGIDGVRFITCDASAKPSDEVIVLDSGRKITKGMIVEACTNVHGLGEIFGS